MRKISEVKAKIQNVEGKKDFQKVSDENQKKSLEQEIKKYIKFMKNDMAKAYGINKIRKK